MFREEGTVMAPLIEGTDNYGSEIANGRLPHPYVVLSHVGFRGAALIFYLLCGWFSDSFIYSFLITVLLLSIDFWTVKNITGRILVGLRWWNYIDDNGNSHWIFESRKDLERHPINSMESKIFWGGLIIFPFFWGVMFIAALLTFKFKWVLLVLIALILNSSNIFGYMKCRFQNSDKSIRETLTSETSNFFKEQLIQNISTMNFQPSQNGATNMQNI